MSDLAPRLLATVIAAGLASGPASILPNLASEAAAQERRPANPRNPANPRGPRDPRGVADPRGLYDPRGVYDPRGLYDPRGPYDPRNPGYNRYDAWRDARQDYYIYRSVRLGTYYATRPAYSTTVIVSGQSYFYSGGFFYVKSGVGYVVAAPPRGAVVYSVPRATVVTYVGPSPYYYYGGAFYIATTLPAARPSETPASVTSSNQSGGNTASVSASASSEGAQNYQVVAAPVGASVPYLPDDAIEKKVNGKTYFVYNDAYYQAFTSDSETIYLVVTDPTVPTANVDTPRANTARVEAAASPANSCVTGLSANGKKVYEAAAPNIDPGGDVEEQFKSIVRTMVMNGELSRSGAKSAAEEAARCLRT